MNKSDKDKSKTKIKLESKTHRNQKKKYSDDIEVAENIYTSIFLKTLSGLIYAKQLNSEK